jgi:hypothetical protein
MRLLIALILSSGIALAIPPARQAPHSEAASAPWTRDLQDAAAELRLLKGFMSKRENKITVPLEPEQREFVERTAAREDRTLAGQIRHFIAEVARRVQVEERTA